MEWLHLDIKLSVGMLLIIILLPKISLWVRVELNFFLSMFLLINRYFTIKTCHPYNGHKINYENSQREMLKAKILGFVLHVPMKEKIYEGV
jgi:hypothetical protein